MARKTLDPVTRYATAVCAGKVIAARMVRQACARHLRDLEDGEARGLVWKPESAQDAISFFPDVLCLPEESDSDDEVEQDDARPVGAGTPFVLSPFQQFIVGSLFGWCAHRVSKKGIRRLGRRFRVAYVETGKGSGKTPLGAGILLYLLVADGERGAQLFTAAVTREQAKLAFTDCVAMVNSSPHLKALIDQRVNNLAVLETGSFIRPISSERRGLDGKRVQGAVIDELHEHPTADVAVKMRAGTKGRRNALLFIPTNSGYDRESICWHYHDYSRQVLEDTLQNDAWFAFVCHLDPCDKCHAAGHLQPNDECDQCDDWKTEGPHWLKANPNIGVSLPWQYLREQVREAISIPSQRNMVRRLNFCQWTQQATVWIPIEQWTLCKGTISSASLVGRECFVGIDLSDKIDLSSVVLVFPRPMDKPATVPRKDGEVSLDRAIDVLSYFWMPAKSIARRANEDKVPYPDWAADGWITPTTGSLVDYDVIVDFIINVVAKKYLIRGIGIDQAGATAVVTRLRSHFGEEMVDEIPQGFRALSDPSKTFEALIVSGNLAHDGNPVMAMCVGNLAIEENHWREIRPIKISQRKRIDGGVACIDAIKKMQLAPPPSRPSVYMTRGIRVAGD